ncbi:FAD-binding oxidoreductase [Calothrix sp. CCY 0018]|uniref:FAD-binding oxidoreductase n=1 Tax=Calothrix sp. CCY 0018 TaxID=3103864 RepID=UPI0039C5BBE3
MKITVFNPKIAFIQEKELAASTDNGSTLLIGRHPNCDLVLDTPEVSRIHGLITYFQQNYYFTELASIDGSRLNNQEVLVNQKCILQLGDILKIGDFFLLLLSEEEKLEKSNPYWFLKPQIKNDDTQLTSDTQDKQIVKCCQIIEETHDVKTFRFITSPPTTFNYKPGQFVTLELEINGKLVKRSYSISSTPSRPQNLEITVKRVPSGLVSNWLHDKFTLGDQIKISPPTGNFTIPDNLNRKFMFISAGSGITPMMSMSRWLCDTIPNADITFVHSAKTLKDIVFRQELELMASRNAYFQLAVTLTSSGYNPTWLGYTGRLNEATIKAIANDLQERIVYVCGPDSFRESVKAILGELDFPMQNYHEESFGYSKKPKKYLPVVADDTPKHFYSTPYEPASKKSNIVTFTKSQKEVVCDAEETILEAAQKEGITLPYGCQMGACGKCKLHKLSGEVYYEQGFDCEEDYVLTCVTKAEGNVIIEG